MRPAVLALLAGMAPSSAFAGAWSMPAGETQVIVKVERLRTRSGYDQDGILRLLPAERADDTASVYAEHGLTDRLTVQLKSEYQRGSEFETAFEGLGPTEIGLRYQVWRNDHFVVSAYAGHAFAGEARNAGYAEPGQGQGDWEVRALAGYSGRVERFSVDVFAEVQAARRFRRELPDEDRLDLALGTGYRNWTLLTQVYSGRTRTDEDAYWINGEVSVIRRFGDWSVQAGWRDALSGRRTAAQSGVILALWRRF